MPPRKKQYQNAWMMPGTKRKMVRRTLIAKWLPIAQLECIKTARGGRKMQAMISMRPLTAMAMVRDYRCGAQPTRTAQKEGWTGSELVARNDSLLIRASRGAMIRRGFGNEKAREKFCVASGAVKSAHLLEQCSAHSCCDSIAAATLAQATS